MNGSPGWFRPLAGVALLWNLLGCLAYLMDVKIAPDRLSQMSAAQQALYAARPWWAVAGTATAVWLGAAGCVGLLLGRRWAARLFAVSLIGVLIQDLWLFALSGAAAEAGAASFVAQGAVLVIAIALVQLARRGTALGWLS